MPRSSGDTALSKPEPKDPDLTLEHGAPGCPPVQRLIEQLLLGRLDGLEGRAVAAFLAGWSSALELVRRVDVTMPDATPEVADSIRRLVSAIDQAQCAVVAESED
jgi:hypothetical protein